MIAVTYFLLKELIVNAIAKYLIEFDIVFVGNSQKYENTIKQTIFRYKVYFTYYFSSSRIEFLCTFSYFLRRISSWFFMEILHLESKTICFLHNCVVAVAMRFSFATLRILFLEPSNQNHFHRYGNENVGV